MRIFRFRNRMPRLLLYRHLNPDLKLYPSFLASNREPQNERIRAEVSLNHQAFCPVAFPSTQRIVESEHPRT